MTKDEALRILAEHRNEILAKSVRTLFLFGPVLTQDIGPDGEIDVLVEFTRPVGLEYFGLAQLLTDLFGRSVNLASVDNLRPSDQAEIVKGCVRAA